MNFPSPDPLSVSLVPVGHVTVVELAGVLDLANAGQLRDAAAVTTAGGRAWLVLDLGGVEFCDAAGLGALVACRRMARENGGGLCLARVRPRLANLLRLTSLTEALPVYAWPAEAVAALDGQRRGSLEHGTSVGGSALSAGWPS